RIAGSTAEAVLVGQVGTFPQHCDTNTWDEQAGVAYVACVTPAAVPEDDKYSVLWLERGRPGQRLGIAFANKAGALGDFPLNPDFSFNSAGGTIIQRETAIGTYQIIFGGLAKVGAATETVIVSKFGAPFPRRSPVGWV